MSIRERLQDGFGRGPATIILAVAGGTACWFLWPQTAADQESFLSGLQKLAFVSAAFAVTAYNLRTRVVDLVLKLDVQPERMEVFARIARQCGMRLTNLVLLFTCTAVVLGGLTIFPTSSFAAKIGASVSLFLFPAACVSFFYIVHSFDRLERFALDEAERACRAREAKRLRGNSEVE